jgi:hypothetical protein
VKLDPPKLLQDGRYLIRARTTAARGEADNAALCRAFAAALESMPDGEQAESVSISWGRDRGYERRFSRRFYLSLLTFERREVDDD